VPGDPEGQGQEVRRLRVGRAYARRVDLERVSVDHRVMGGAPCIRGTRMPIATVVNMVADGVTLTEMISEFPQLTPDDVRDALRYTALIVSLQFSGSA
jgi:uncharacterized protein (DUF433 family)